MRVLIVGNRGGTNIGERFEIAARSLQIDVQLSESRLAMEGPAMIQKLNWWFRGRRPTRLLEFGNELVQSCKKFRPHTLLSTGIAPIDKNSLRELKELNIRRINYLTDDPFNPAHHASWFLEALPYYDHVFSVRKSNLNDLKKLGCPQVNYLPFGYAPELHYPETPATVEEQSKFGCDIVFYGGADKDRFLYARALVKAGFDVALYGDYWERYSETRAHFRGYADPRTVRLAIGGAKVSLCLVRRANRDGNSMRTFEIPAIGGCMLTEGTEEHQEIFGEEGKTVVYFKAIPEMIEKLRWLLSNGEERQRLAQAGHHLVINGNHTYKDRLLAMLNGK